MENEILLQILTELKELNVRQNGMGEELMAFQEFTMQGQLDRIEKRVTAHDEIVFRRVK